MTHCHTEAYLFKNGYSFLIKDIDLAESEGETSKIIEEVPEYAVNGSLWIDSPQQCVIRNMRSTTIKKSIERDASNLKDIIRCNIENQVSFKYNTQADLWDDFSGTIQKLLPDNSNATKMLVKDDKSMTRLFDIDKVKYLSSKDLKLSYTTEEDYKTLEVLYYGGGQCKFMYLTFGLVWIPSYKLIMDKENGTFKLKLNATFISNEKLNLSKIDNVHCVVGLPNMTYSDQDPLLDNRNVEETIKLFTDYIKTMEDKHKDRTGNNKLHKHGYAEAIKRRKQNKFTITSLKRNDSLNSYEENQNNNLNYAMNNVQMQMMPTQHNEYTGGFNELNSGNEDEAAQTESLDNLFLYDFQNLEIEDKMRQNINVFEHDIDYQNVYTAEIDTGVVDKTQTVWHTINFTNKTGYALTTGPVMILSTTNAYISQDMLKFCSKNAEGSIKLTKAMDIKVMYEPGKAEKEEEGWLMSKNVLTVKNDTIKIQNLKKEKIKVQVSMNLYGQLSYSSPQVKSNKITRSTSKYDVSSKAVWEIEVGKESTSKISFQIKKLG